MTMKPVVLNIKHKRAENKRPPNHTIRGPLNFPNFIFLTLCHSSFIWKVDCAGINNKEAVPYVTTSFH